MKINLKNRTLSLVSIFFLAACTVSPSASENMASEMECLALETVVAPVLTQIEMLDEQNGWAQAEGMILRTEVGGETWLDVTADKIYNDPAYAKSFFMDEKTAWVLIEDVDGPMVATLFHTIDGGQTWNWRNTPFGRSDFGFLDVEHGYALTNLGATVGSMGVAIWETKNSGGDWDRTFVHQPGLNDSLPFNGIKNGVSFVSKLDGWVSGFVPQDGFFWLYRTRDGGFTWEHQGLEFPAGYENAQVDVFAPQFFNEGDGVLAVNLLGEQMAIAFYLSIDGGETWNVHLPLVTDGMYSLISAQEFIVWDGGERMFTTKDGGLTWGFHESDFQPRERLVALDFVSLSTGWVLTEEGLYGTRDGGEHWVLLGE